MFDISYPIAFSAGLISFFAPCVVPLLPAYIGYVTGVSVGELSNKGYNVSYLKKLLGGSLFYILGFSMVFVILGTSAAELGVILRRWNFIIQRAGGLIILLLGLEYAQIIHLSFLTRSRQFSLPKWGEKPKYGRAFLVGFIFATAWTPCVGVVLGSILALAAVSGTAFRGASLLFVYSLGISLPFIIVSLTLASAPKYISFINRHIGIIAKVAGLALALLGLLLLTNTYRFLNSWLFGVAFKLGYQIK